MGADPYATYAYHEDLKTAFWSAVEECLYANGHGGYTGTLAEKDAVTDLGVVADNESEAMEWAEDLMGSDWSGRTDIPGYDKYQHDKWGPANAIKIKTGGWVLFGLCSS